MKSIGETWSNFRTFLAETRSEMKKVTFPSRSEVVSTTVVVIIASFIFAFFLWAADILIVHAYQGIFHALSS
jgi:preprotein translocase subunit SecE